MKQNVCGSSCHIGWREDPGCHITLTVTKCIALTAVMQDMTTCLLKVVDGSGPKSFFVQTEMGEGVWHFGNSVPQGNQSKRPHSKTATTRTATLSGITTRTATLLWSKRPHCFGQNGHIGWVATKTATLFWSKGPHSFGQNGHKVGFT